MKPHQLRISPHLYTKVEKCVVVIAPFQLSQHQRRIGKDRCHNAHCDSTTSTAQRAEIRKYYSRCPGIEKKDLHIASRLRVFQQAMNIKTRVRIGNWIYWILTGHNYKNYYTIDDL
jgi:hypothetical protein